MAGGLRGRATEAVLEPLLTFIEEHHLEVRGLGRCELAGAEGQTLYEGCSWDFETAFDRVTLELVFDIWADLGVPVELADGVRQLWSELRR
eukprot:15475424-Alexandrium_andersonii.AAC.1